MTLDPRSPSMNLWHRLLAAGASEHEATELMHGYAHELAERVRAERGSGDYEPGVYFRAGMDYAADLIDPKAQSAHPGVVGGPR